MRSRRAWRSPSPRQPQRCADIPRLALYEPPYLAELEESGRAETYTAQLNELLQAGDRGGAVALFMARVGIPQQVIDGMRGSPGWPRIEAIAPTLAYDDELLAGGRVPREIAAQITAPALLLSGSASPDSLQQAAAATADALPNAEHRTLEGQTHDVAPDALAPVLIGVLQLVSRGVDRASRAPSASALPRPRHDRPG